MLTDPADERNRNQKPEQSQAGNRLPDVRDPQRDRPRPRMRRDGQPERNRDRRSDQNRAQYQHQMLSEQLDAFFEQILKNIVKHFATSAFQHIEKCPGLRVCAGPEFLGRPRKREMSLVQ